MTFQAIALQYLGRTEEAKLNAEKTFEKLVKIINSLQTMYADRLEEKYSNEENFERDAYFSQAQSEFEMKFKKLFNKERYLAEKKKPMKKIHGNKIKSIISKSFLKTNNNWLN